MKKAFVFGLILGAFLVSVAHGDSYKIVGPEGIKTFTEKADAVRYCLFHEGKIESVEETRQVVLGKNLSFKKAKKRKVIDD